MVQYSPPYWRGLPELANKHYWKLDNAENDTSERLLERLQQRGVAHQPSSNQHVDRDRLLQLYSRAQRNLPFYDGLGYDELHGFCQSRQLDLSRQDQDRPLDRDQLQSILEQADEDATFNRFLDLPPELRLRIYELHKASLMFKEFSTAPPITSVSKLVRAEALSVFFHHRLFMMHWVYNEDTQQQELELQVVTDLFFGSAPMAMVGAVRKLYIMSPIGPSGSTGYAEFRVDLTARRPGRRAFFERFGTFCRNRLPGPSRKDAVVVKAVQEELRVFAERVLSRTPVAFIRTAADAILAIFKTSNQME